MNYFIAYYSFFLISLFWQKGKNYHHIPVKRIFE